MKRIGFIFFISLISVFTSWAQNSLMNVVPLSPEAAALTKYVDAPVGHFTGVPSISIPLYSIQSKRLSLPLSLSYHAGGNKVEEIATWVGLGWSLGSLPSISRRVNGSPDEGPGGYFEKYNGFTVKTILDSAWHTEGWFASLYNEAIKSGEYDLEADIFYYNLPGKSGRFYWNQELEEFIPDPYNNLRITKDGGFKIIDDDGTIYQFGTTESSQTNGASAGPNIVTSWLVDKVYDANKTDSLEFTYHFVNTSSSTINIVEKPVKGSCPPPPSYLSTTYNSTRPISTIKFANGVVQFEMRDTLRRDLVGGYALSKIKVKNRDSLLLKDIHLKTSYRGQSICAGSSLYEGRRLFLDTVEMFGSNTTIGEKYSFVYDSVITFPCRNSYEQDYWGYYNGQTGNTSLVPTWIYTLPSYEKELISGANRNVSPAHNQMGILKRITYPTGGYTVYDYEPNQARNINLPYDYSVSMAYLEGEAPGPITTDTYIDTFTVQNVDDVYLNNNTGGAFLTAAISDYGCDLSGGGNSCATFTIQGIDPENSSYYAMVLTDNVKDWWVPNGRYEIKAVFNQSPPLYDGFNFTVTWLSLDSSQVPLNRYVGGLRLKSLKSFSTTGENIEKRFRYTTRLDSDTSSGDIFGSAFFMAFEGIFFNSTSTSCFQTSVGPNMPSVTHSGSYMGYRRVFVESDSLRSKGLMQYEFTHMKDGIYEGCPFPPPTSYESFRGQPKLEMAFSKNGDDLLPISKTTYEYANETIDSLVAYCYKLRFVGLGDDRQQDCIPMFYFVTPTWSQATKKVDRFYDQKDTSKFTETVSEFKYYSPSLQLEQAITLNSKGDTLKTKYSYPSNLSLAGNAETARQALILQNNIAIPLKTQTYNNSALLNETVINYKKFTSGELVYPEEIFQRIGSGSSESKVKFLKYSLNGNLLEQQKTNDVQRSYLWDYLHSQPIAECINADSASIAFTSFEADGKGGWTYTGYPTTSAASPTGTKNYSLLNGNISRTSLTSRTYIVSYWGTGSALVNSLGPVRTGFNFNGWTYYEHEVTSTSITVSGSVQIDELRLYPKGAMMSSYTYIPLVGVSSVSDANGVIVYYEYDSFNRLSMVRDMHRNVLKKYCYNYAGEVEDCMVYTNVLKSGSFTKECGLDSTGSTVVYEVPAGTYSSTTSQTEADSLAQADVNANGQAFANTNGTCTAPACDSGNCSGANKKCINGVCETGVKTFISSTAIGKNSWSCTYVYFFSDCSYKSGGTETHSSACMILPCL